MTRKRKPTREEVLEARLERTERHNQRMRRAILRLALVDVDAEHYTLDTDEELDGKARELRDAWREAVESTAGLKGND
jgi:hypothetical protein